jgi:glycosyltransferase involved in cell wall biosynthesis
LVIAGGASHTNDYYKQIQEKAKEDSRIIMTGFVQGEMLQELYSNCYLYVLPSDVEGMPISLLEAMSYGRNCLVSNIEENVQVTEKFATSFEKSNVQDLKDKLEKCLNGENRKNEKEISDYILKKYNWDDVVKETEMLYKGEK